MNTPHRFLIVDGYPEKSREELKAAGVGFAYELYAKMLRKYLPEAEYDVLLPADEKTPIPQGKGLERYAGILWTGSNLRILDRHIPTVRVQIDLAKAAYQIGIPSFGSCWGLQIAVVAAGGFVGKNPKGRQMGIARKIVLTEKGKRHPMYAGKPKVFDAFASHEDIVLKTAEGSAILAGNEFVPIQALSVTHGKGTFWSVQYHPEFGLKEMACLINARAERLMEIGYFRQSKEVTQMVERMKRLHDEPDRKDLRWQLAVDEDLLSANIRQCEFRNWIRTFFPTKERA